jgi:predicted Zn-dependent protease
LAVFGHFGLFKYDVDQKIRITFIYDRFAISNTAGGDFFVEETLASLNVCMQANGQTGYGFSHARHLDDLKPAMVLKETLEDVTFPSAKALKGSPKFETVVFHPNAFSALTYLTLLPYLAGTAYNPLLYSSNSRFSENIRIEDNGRTPKRVGSSSIDHEGVITSNKVIVRNGRIESLMLDLTTAKMRNMESTGNGFREVKVDDKLFGYRQEMYKNRPRVCPTNLTIVGEKTMDFPEMIQNHITELYIKHFFWPHECPTCPGPSSQSLWETQLCFRNGERQHKVKGAALVLDSMHNISDIFGNIHFASSDSVANYICCPWVLASELQFTSYDRLGIDVITV